jgi:hypothetical protein
MGQELGIGRVVRQTGQNAGERSDHTAQRGTAMVFIVEILWEFAFELFAHVILEICVWAWKTTKDRTATAVRELSFERTCFFRPF